MQDGAKNVRSQGWVEGHTHDFHQFVSHLKPDISTAISETKQTNKVCFLIKVT